MVAVVAAAVGALLVVLGLEVGTHSGARPDFGQIASAPAAAAVPGTPIRSAPAGASASSDDAVPAVVPSRRTAELPTAAGTTPSVSTPRRPVAMTSHPVDSAARATRATSTRATVARATPAPVSVAVAALPAPARPQKIDMPRLSVEAMVLPVRSTDGVLEVPDNPSEIGWWIGSAPPGSAEGTTVLAGHVDSAKWGLGAFHQLVDLVAGDLVNVTTTAGRREAYRVTARRTYDKSAGLPAELFTRGGPARLVLVTCGGQFDDTAKSYDDNIVVIATPSGR